MLGGIIRWNDSQYHLVHPDWNKDFVIIIDASMISRVPGGRWRKRKLDFTSKLLKPCEQRYSISEMEMLSLVHAVRKWRMWLMGHRVEALTDHQALVHMEKIRLGNSGFYHWYCKISIWGFLTFPAYPMSQPTLYLERKGPRCREPIRYMLLD